MPKERKSGLDPDLPQSDCTESLDSLAVTTELMHNGQSISNYPSSKYFFVPFPQAKGVPFNADNLATVNGYSFSAEKEFVVAKEAADTRWAPSSRDISWRLHVFLWCAQSALALNPSGSWVELGTGKGYSATAILTLIDFAPQIGRPKKFLLFDRFSTTYPNSNSLPESDGGEKLFYYTDDYLEVKEHFSQWDFVEVVSGELPGSLTKLKAETLSFVHVDLNDSATEIDCLQLLSNVLCPGALVLFDDSGNPGCQESLGRHKEWAKENGLAFLQLPTGQGSVQWRL